MIKKQILDFVLKNWKAILIVLLLLVMVLKTRYDYHLMEKAYNTMIDSNKAQLEGLRQLHEEEIEAKERLLNKYISDMNELEQRYDITIQELEKQRTKKQRKYYKKFSQNEKDFIKDIEKILGVEYVSP
jgi:hypothetical protein